ncbi:MAG: hypothetical protein DMG40_24845 [Acidobacteria bacterium]|nr:MAG: hypothetical protein DMG40_24845 [Acidobacteriota bacterium]
MRILRFLLLFVVAAEILAIPAPSQAQIAVGVSIRMDPPALPVYAQPICPGPGYMWVPGYWAYGPDGYFWVPGTWVLAPEPGLLWTPGYWGFAEGGYVWHAGYWGPHVGFYGGIYYGFGYTGVGFVGGYWRGGNYYYNRSVTNVNVTVIHNTYNTTVVNNTTINRVSFNGGAGGINARPTHEELAFEHERHVAMTAEQNHHFEAARGDRRFLASANHGRPEVAASARSGEFRGRGVEHAREAKMDRPDNRGGFNRPDRGRDNGRFRDERPPSAQNSRLDEKHQRGTDRIERQQDSERQKLQRRHDQERDRFSHQNASQQRQDQLQRRQQQQMDQMNRRHEQQSQKFQERQQRENQRREGKPHK